MTAFLQKCEGNAIDAIAPQARRKLRLDCLPGDVEKLALLLQMHVLPSS
jgi:hypothetical protein